MPVAILLNADEAVTCLLAERPEITGRGRVGNQHHDLRSWIELSQRLSRPEDR